MHRGHDTPNKPPRNISETDPDAAWSLKVGPGRFSYETNSLLDTDHGIIMDAEATPVRFSREIAAARTMLEQSAKQRYFQSDRITADAPYAWGHFKSHRIFLCWTTSTRPTANTILATFNMLLSVTATPAVSPSNTCSYPQVWCGRLLHPRT